MTRSATTCARPTGSPAPSTTRPDIPLVGHAAIRTLTRPPAATSTDVPVPVGLRCPYSAGRYPCRFATTHHAPAATLSNRNDPSAAVVAVCTRVPGGAVAGGSLRILTTAPASGPPPGDRVTTPEIDPRLSGCWA